MNPAKHSRYRGAPRPPLHALPVEALLILVAALVLCSCARRAPDESASIEAVLVEEFGEGISFMDLEPIQVSDDLVVLHTDAGRLYVAWLTRAGSTLKVEGRRKVPEELTQDSVAWRVWSPGKAKGLFIARGSARVTEVSATDQDGKTIYQYPAASTAHPWAPGTGAQGG